MRTIYRVGRNSSRVEQDKCVCFVELSDGTDWLIHENVYFSGVTLDVIHAVMILIIANQKNGKIFRFQWEIPVNSLKGDETWVKK